MFWHHNVRGGRLVFFLFMFYSPVVFCQVQPNNFLKTRFEHNVSRYWWQGILNIDQSFHNSRLQFYTQFDSEAYQLGQNSLSFRDEESTFLKASTVLHPRLTALLEANTSFFSQSHVFTQDVLSGILWRPHTSVELNPMIGFAWDRRAGIPDAIGNFPLYLDTGPASTLNFQVSPTVGENNQLTFLGKNDIQWIQPRRSHTVNLQSLFQRAVSNALLNVQIQYANLRRDTYQPASFLNREEDFQQQTIEATTGDTLQVMLNFNAPLNNFFSLTGNAQFLNNRRFIRTQQAPEDALFFNTDLYHIDFIGESGLRYESGNKNVQLTFRWGAEVQERRLENRDALPPNQAALKGDLLQKTNFDKGNFGIQGGVQLPLTKRSEIHIEGNSSILRYDTPASNPDDRDEVFHSGQARLVTTLNPHFQIRTELLGTFYHTVYLKASRSAENNIQRSLRLRPALQWQPTDNTQLQLTPEIRATYTVEDFEPQSAQTNDQSARELRYQLRLTYHLPDEQTLYLDGTYSDLHLGRLLWKDFAEIPFDSVQTWGGWLRISTGKTWQATFGIRYYERNDFDRATGVTYQELDENGKVVLDNQGQPRTDFVVRPGRQIIRQLGPTATLVVPLRNNSFVQLDGWAQWQHTFQKLYGTLPEGLETHIRKTAKEGKQTVIPNVSLSVNWVF